MKRIFKFFLQLVVIVFLFLAVVGIVFIVMKDSDGITRFGDYITISVNDDVMEPTIMTNDLIIEKKIDDVQKIKVNDVISYFYNSNGTDEIRTGRVLSIASEGDSISWRVKGDNQSEGDVVTVLPRNLVGQFTNTKLLFVGSLLLLLESKNGFLLCVVAPLFLIFVYQLYKLIASIILSKKGSKEEISEENKDDINDDNSHFANDTSTDIEVNNNVVVDNQETNEVELAPPIVVSEPLYDTNSVVNSNNSSKENDNNSSDDIEIL